MSRWSSPATHADHCHHRSPVAWRHWRPSLVLSVPPYRYTAASPRRWCSSAPMPLGRSASRSVARDADTMRGPAMVAGRAGLLSVTTASVAAPLAWGFSRRQSAWGWQPESCACGHASGGSWNGRWPEAWWAWRHRRTVAGYEIPPGRRYAPCSEKKYGERWRGRGSDTWKRFLLGGCSVRTRPRSPAGNGRVVARRRRQALAARGCYRGKR